MKTYSLVLSILFFFLFAATESSSQTVKGGSLPEDLSWIYGAWKYTTDDGIRQVITINQNRSVNYAMYDFTGKIKTNFNSGLIASQDYNSFDMSSIGGEDVLLIGNKGGKIAISLYVDKRGRRLLTWGTKEPMEKERTLTLGGEVHESKIEFMKDVNSTRDYLQSTVFISQLYGELLGCLFFEADGVYRLLTPKVKGGDGKKYKIGNSYTIRKSTEAYSFIDISCLSGETITLTLFARNNAYHNNEVKIYADTRGNDTEVLQRYEILPETFRPCDEPEELLERLAAISSYNSYSEMDYNSLLSKANKEDSRAQNELGWRYEHGKGGVSQDMKEAVKWFRKAAENGNSAAQSNLGIFYDYGKGVQQDYAEAVKWYKKSAEQGNPQGQNNLGWCYQKGKGVQQDYAEAVKWYKKSAEQGNTSAQYSLGMCYYGGKGVPQNYSEAVKWLRKSAEQGDATAQYTLSTCYQTGKGVPQNYSEMVKWCRKSAEQGEKWAQYLLGMSYQYGKGVRQDNSEAVKWYKKSAEQGCEEAKKKLESLR